MRITLVAAVSSDGFISRGSGVPWSLPEDVRRFRAYCEGKWLLAGRRTFEEMRGWFRAGQTPVVVTRQADFSVAGGHAAASVEAALALAAAAGAEECVVIGGGEIYAAAMPHADALRLTEVALALGHGVRFPAVRSEEWREVERQAFPADGDHAVPFVMREMRRIHVHRCGEDGS